MANDLPLRPLSTNHASERSRRKRKGNNSQNTCTSTLLAPHKELNEDNQTKLIPRMKLEGQSVGSALPAQQPLPSTNVNSNQRQLFLIPTQESKLPSTIIRIPNSKAITTRKKRNMDTSTTTISATTITSTLNHIPFSSGHCDDKKLTVIRGIPSNADRKLYAKAKLLTMKDQPNSTTNQATSSSRDHPCVPVGLPQISKIRFGCYLFKALYSAPYPEEYTRQPILYICEYCLKYMATERTAERHKENCLVKHPPGDEIYRDGDVSIFEVDGRKNKIYCQNLCLLSKLFLDHKTLYYDVEPFYFYVLTKADKLGCHFVGYFSKEKWSSMNYNISCILVLPIYQRKGYGQCLIDFSYNLSKIEGKIATPERPLSDSGLNSYQHYWKNAIYLLLQTQVDPISIADISMKTKITPNDIISTLHHLNMITTTSDAQCNDHTKRQSPYSSAAERRYKLVVDLDKINTHIQKMNGSHLLRVNPSKLRWSPPLVPPRTID